MELLKTKCTKYANWVYKIAIYFAVQFYSKNCGRLLLGAFIYLFIYIIYFIYLFGHDHLQIRKASVVVRSLQHSNKAKQLAVMVKIKKDKHQNSSSEKPLFILYCWLLVLKKGFSEGMGCVCVFPTSKSEVLFWILFVPQICVALLCKMF